MTTWWGWATRRARSSLVLLATLFALVAVTTGILAFALGNSGALATSAARAALASADPAEAGVRAQTRLAPDADAQDALAREKLTEGFAPAPISVWTTYVSEPRPGTGPDGALKERLILWSGEHLSPDVLEVDGQWPAASGQAALHRDAAATLGLELGDPLTVDDHELTITALWAPADPADPRWFADDLALRGAEGVHLGPLVVDRSVLTGGQPFVQWGVVPDAEHISASDLGAPAAGAERAKALVEEADVTGRGITTEGNLAPTAARAARELAVAEAFGFVPVSLLLLVAVVGLVQVAGLLAATREKELNLLFARGSSTGQVLGAGIVEAVVVALLGDAVGTGAAALVVRLTSGTWEHTPAVLGGGLASLGIALLCLIGVSANATLRASRGGQARSDRVKTVAGAAALVLVSGAAALATWQLRRSGSFVREQDGVTGTDLLPALSPALLLAAVAVVGLVVLAPVTRLLEVAARGLRSTAAWLAGAQLARGLVVQAVPVVLTILATGTATFAALYSGTGAALTRDIAALSQGAQLRATLAPTQRGPLEFPTLDGVPGVAASAPVWLDADARIGDLTLTALAAPMGTLGDVAELPGEQALPVESLLPAAPDSHAPAPIPEGTETLSVTLEGAISLNPWAEQGIALIPAYHRSIADLMQAGTPKSVRDSQYLLGTEGEFRALATPLTVQTTLTLRDADTGETSEVRGAQLAFPASEVTWDEGFTNVEFVGAEATATLDIALPAGRRFVLDAVGFQPTRTLDGGSLVSRSVDATLSIDADGVPVLGSATADWVADQALRWDAAEPYRAATASVTPEVRLVDEVFQTEFGDIVGKRFDSNEPVSEVTTVDPTDEVWRVHFDQQVDPFVAGPRVAFNPVYDPLGVATAQAPPPAPPVPVALTPALSEATTLDVGDTFEAFLAGRGVPAEVVAVTESIPGLTTPLGLLVDTGAWSASRASLLEELVPPTELWARLDGDPQQARDAAITLPGIASVTVSEGGSEAEAAPAAQAFWVAAASALVLAVTGLAAATATQVAHRRPEVAVLRAMGMTPSAQGRSRAWEIGGILGLATLAGVAAGWLVGWLIVDPVTRSASADDIAFPTRLTLDIGPWLVLLGLGAAAVAVILVLLGRAVRRQALDNEYREEVR